MLKCCKFYIFVITFATTKATCSYQVFVSEFLLLTAKTLYCKSDQYLLVSTSNLCLLFVGGVSPGLFHLYPSNQSFITNKLYLP
jgi:hypothetical protein